MRLFDAGWVLLLLPLGGIAASYLSETRRGSAWAVWGAAWLTLAASLLLLAATVAHHTVVDQSTITFWSFSVTQTPFNAATATLLPATFQVGVGFAATPFGAVLAVLASVTVLLGEAQLMGQLRSSPQLPTLMRLSALLGLAALLVVLAPGLFQLFLGFGLTGLLASLLAGAGGGTGFGRAARYTHVAWTAGTASLLLAVVFVYTKFAGAVAVAATTGKHATAQTPYGLNLTALDAIWQAAHRGAVNAVGGRTLTLAAVLFLVAAACGAGQLPLQGVWRALAHAPSGAGPLLQGLSGVVVPASLLLAVFPLLHLASGAQPALLVLGSVSSLAGAVLALGEQRLLRFPAWVALSQAGMVLVAIGVGSPAAAVALAISTVLVGMALGTATSRLSLDLRVDTVQRLGLAWRQARPSGWAMLGALAAGSGALGLGAFFARSEVLAAALSSGPEAAALRVVAVVAVILSPLAVAAGCGRLAWHLLRGADPSDPREARSARRQLSQGQRQAGDSVPIVAAVLAVLAGVLALILGRMLPEPGAIPGLSASGAALLAMTVLPLLGLALAWTAGARLGAPARTLGVLDGTALLAAATDLGLGWPAEAVEAFTTRVWQPVADGAGGVLAELLGADEGGAGPIWDRWAGAAVLALLALAVAAASWWGLA